MMYDGKVLKKELTSVDVAAVLHELNKTILDARINNIYQTDGQTLLVKLHKPDKPASHLIVEAGKQLHLTSYVLDKPKVPPAFCMALRKHIRNGRLTRIKQYEFERIVTFTIEKKAGELRLVSELFREGNIILVDSENKILQALRYRRMRDRNILRHETFCHAPSRGRNPLKIRGEEMDELRRFGDVEVVRALTEFLSVGGVYAEEILLRAEVDKKTPCKKLRDCELNGILEAMQDIVCRVADGRFEPCVVLDRDGGVIDAVPIRLRRYEGFRHECYGSFNEALDAFYTGVAVTKKAVADVEAEKLKKEADRLRRMIESQEEALVEAEKKAERNKRIGDVIYSHLGELQLLVDKFSADKESRKDRAQIVSEVEAEKKDGLKPAEFFVSLDRKGLLLSVCVENLSVALDLRKDLFANAAWFYERGKKAKRKLEGVKVALEDSREKLEEVEAKIGEAEALKKKIKPVEALKELAKRKVKRKEWFEKFRWFVSSEGFLVVGGKDAVSNEVLIRKHTESEDVVFHADVVGAPFVVMKTEGKKLSERTLSEAAEFAAVFSRGWREGYGSVDVFYVKPEQLSKGAPSGMFVRRGAFVVRGKRNWLRGVPLRTAVGVVVENDTLSFVGGPVDAIKSKTNTYVIIEPGDVKGKELFRRVLGVVAEKVSKELRRKILQASAEEIRKFIPFSKGRVLENLPGPKQR
jgi:predicted ribosome quality control (RQC) complex YloA/Tae2 family protein